METCWDLIQRNCERGWWVSKMQKNNNNNNFSNWNWFRKAVSQRDEWNGACNAHGSCENTYKFTKCRIQMHLVHYVLFEFDVYMCSPRVCCTAQHMDTLMYRICFIQYWTEHFSDLWCVQFVCIHLIEKVVHACNRGIFMCVWFE